MAPSKAPKKQQKRGIDFKKIKRKLGRKLPPAKNATNTDIKFKAIILPEQSVATEKIGLAVNKKGLTLKELLQQTSHHNVKVRKDALIGIRDLLLKHPTELTLHKYAVIEKLRERIGDDDKLVRETLYQLFKSVIFPGCKEDAQGIFISLLTAYIFNAMTNLAIEVRLMAFKFFDLVVQHYPNSFFLHAEKILQNYEDVLRKNKLYLQEKGKLKTALSGLVRCLSLLPCDQREVDSLEKMNAGQKVLYAFDTDLRTKSHGYSAIIPKVKDLVPVLVNCFEEFVPAIQDETISSISKVLYKRLLSMFPLDPVPQCSGKGDERYFALNTALTEIYLHLSEWNSSPAISLERFLGFIEFALLGKTRLGAPGKAVKDKNLLSLLPFIPKLVALAEAEWKAQLLQAFTGAFLDCNPESSLKMACLATIEEMLIPREGISYIDPRDPDILDHQIAWIRELPALLIKLGDKHPACSLAVLCLQLKLGKYALLNPSIAREYDNIQHSLKELFSSCLDNGDICYGPFIRLPSESQELSLCCIYYFSFLDSALLKSISYCCLCQDLEPSVLFRIIEVINSAYRAGHIQIADYISFFTTLLSSFRVFPDNIFHVTKNDAKISNRGTFKTVTSNICSYISQMGDNTLVFQIIENIILEQITARPPLDNVCAMLRLLATLDSKPTRLNEQNIASLGNLLSVYLIEIALQIPKEDDENRSKTLQYFLIPCFLLFDRSHKLLHFVLRSLGSFIKGSPDDHNQYTKGRSKTVDAIISILLLMHKDMKVRRIVSSLKEDVHFIWQNIVSLQSSKEISLTLEEKHNIQSAIDQLKAVTSSYERVQATLGQCTNIAK